MTRYAVGLGSNLGNRIAHLRTARERLEELGTTVGVSGLYETEPVGGPEQAPYLNAVVVLESELDPHQLLQALHVIEAEAGRERNTRWGPRTLDLDIVSMDRASMSSESLTIPHPRAAKREFVLRPLVDVWPTASVGGGLDAASALAQLENQGVDQLARRWESDNPWPGRFLVTVQLVWFLAIAVTIATDGSLPKAEADLFRFAGVAVALIGGALALASSRQLGPALTAHPEPKKNVVLIETGPYAHARHPIYGGVSLFILGASMILDSLIGSLLSLALIPFFVVKSNYEEKRLRIRYPEYAGYLARVPRRLIPYLI